MTHRQLSRQQLRRVHHRQAQRWAQISEPTPSNAAATGLIISYYGKIAVVETPERQLVRCTLRRHIPALACGDWVVWEPQPDGQGVITALQPRQSLLERPDARGQSRPVAANIDQIAVILAPRPEPSELLLDGYLVAIEAIEVNALVVLNKVDLLTAAELAVWAERLALYSSMGYALIHTSTRQTEGLTALTDALAGHSSLLVGQSGVGKSSLIKTLLPERSIAIQSLSARTGLGAHTTSVSTLYHLPSGGDLIDSPGVRSFDPPRLDAPRLAWCFREFRPFLSHCRFANCTHTAEPDCAVHRAVEHGAIHPQRLHNYQIWYSTFQS